MSNWWLVAGVKMSKQIEIKERISSNYSTDQIKQMMLSAKPRDAINIEDYAGKETVIVHLEPIEGTFSWGLKLVSDYLDEDKIIAASTILNFAFDEKTKDFVWYKGGKVDQFMKGIGANTVTELMGKKVYVDLDKSKEGKVRLTLTHENTKSKMPEV